MPLVALRAQVPRCKPTSSLSCFLCPASKLRLSFVPFRFHGLTDGPVRCSPKYVCFCFSIQTEPDCPGEISDGRVKLSYLAISLSSLGHRVSLLSLIPKPLMR